jgi:hypothetical protein
MPVIPATQEAEIRRMVASSQPQANSLGDPILKKPITYSATMKNKILLFACKWVELENIILTEVSQVQKAKSCMLSLKCGIQT